MLKYSRYRCFNTAAFAAANRKGEIFMGNRLKIWRLERGLTQQALASVSGVPRHIIQLTESGLIKPSLAQQDLMARILNVPVSKLFLTKDQDSNLVITKPSQVKER